MDSDSEVFKKSISRLPEWRKSNKSSVKEILDICCNLIASSASLVGAIMPTANTYGYFKERQYTKKAALFLTMMYKNDIHEDVIDKFINELSDHTKEDGYDTLVTLIDRLDNENKAIILSNLVRFCASRRYPKQDFLRVANALERVPYSDLSNLTKYQDDYYEPGESEILYASGLITQTNIKPGVWNNGDDSGIKYGLSKLGEIMLHYGFVYRNYAYHGDGLKVNANSMGWTKID